MPQSLSQVYVHITFSTKGCKKMIDKNIAPKLWEYIGGICRNMECDPITVGGHVDHMHILARLSRKVTQMNLLKQIKQHSSEWIKTKGIQYENFYWQRGYGIFSVNPKQIDIVIKYIKNQEQHHKHKSFREEFRAFLEQYNIPYDERYVWD